MNVGPFVVLFCLSGLLTAIFIVGYSAMGFGLQVIEKSHDFYQEGKSLMMSLVAILLGLYFLDANKWPLIWQELSYVVTFVMLCVALLLLVTETPFGPLCVWTILLPTFLVGVKYVLYRRVDGSTYTQWMYQVLVAQGLVMTILFLTWALQPDQNHMWNATTRAYYSDRVDCPVNYQDLQQCQTVSYNNDDDNNNNNNPPLPCFWQDETKQVVQFTSTCTVHCLDVYEECEEAFLLWASPGLAALALLVIGFTAKYLQPDDPHFSYHGVSMVARFVAIVLFLFWIFASMAGAGEGLSNNLIAFAISLGIGSSFIMAALFWSQLENTKQNLTGAVRQQTENYRDALRGLLVLAALPLILIALVVSVVNQMIRRRLLIPCCSSCIHYTEEERKHCGWFTKAFDDHIVEFKSWNHAKILTYAVYWGYGYVFFNVLASKFTTLFLSWLIEFTASMSVLAVTGIVIFVGMVLFMLPPIPGIPIYLTSGIVLLSVGTETLGVWGSILYACVISQLIKLLAIVVQQKCIGELFGRSVAIRQMVGVNSQAIRAMRVVLSEKGFSANKVYVLVGGPDWPVSVLCGILGLDVLPMLIGSLPVATLVVPTALTGAFAYIGTLEDENGLAEYPWADTMATVTSACTAGAMISFMMLAAAAVKETVEKQKDKMEAIPIDEEVKKADDLAVQKSEAYSQAVVWTNVPIIAKLCLLMATASMIGCFFLLVGFNTHCFTEYDLMYTISEHLGGKWYNLVRPLGRFALLLIVVATILLAAFKAWASGETNKILESGLIKPLTETELIAQGNYA